MANGVRQTSSGVVISESGVGQTVVSSATTIDSYEDESLSEYQDYESNGGTSAWTFDTTNAQDGSVSAELTGDTGYPKCISTSGLNAYPQEGDEFVHYTHHDSTGGTMHFGWYFGASDLDNLYFTRLWPSNDNIELVEKSGGSNYDMVSTSATPSAGWLKWTIQWDDGSTFGGSQYEMTVTVERVDDGSTVLSGSAVAQQHKVTSGGVGMWGAVGSDQYGLWDYSHITNR